MVFTPANERGVLDLLLRKAVGSPSNPEVRTIRFCTVRQAIANHAARAQLRAWPGDSTMCHLTLLDVDMIPTVHDVERWVDEATAASDTDDAFSSIRTGALFPAAAAPFHARGFVEADRLALLERPLDDPPKRRASPGGTSVRRMRGRDLHLAGAIDAASFDADWRNDAHALSDIADATPQSRQRVIAERPPGWGRKRDGSTNALAFAITGRAGETGYLQRLAVLPTARRRGLGRFLVDDACRWLTQRGARRVLVNTGVDNVAAIALYERSGFVRRSDELVVLQLDGIG